MVRWPTTSSILPTMTNFHSQISRRGILQFGAALAAFTSLIPSHPVKARQSSIPAGGCCLKHGSQALITQSTFAGSDWTAADISSGDARFDQALGVLLADLAGKFKVRPGFGYFDDRGRPNALATRSSRFAASEGTVLFGRELLSTYLRRPNGDMSIMAVCAHEFAHVVQFSSGFDERLGREQRTVKLIELHADFLSGYYIGLRKNNFTARELVALGRDWEGLGDSAYTHPNHHGTAEERLRALEQGYRFAQERPNFGIMAACEVGARYLNA